MRDTAEDAQGGRYVATMLNNSEDERTSTSVRVGGAKGIVPQHQGLRKRYWSPQTSQRQLVIGPPLEQRWDMGPESEAHEAFSKSKDDFKTHIRLFQRAEPDKV